jgi:hypothetical protein
MAMVISQNSIYGLSTNPNTHPLLLDSLASTCSAEIALRIAMHTRALKATLAKLAKHDSHEVRCAVGEHEQTPVEILWKLAQDEHPDVRFSLAENHNIPMEILKVLQSDENPYVACRAQQTITRLQSEVTSFITNVSMSLAFAS